MSTGAAAQAAEIAALAGALDPDAGTMGPVTERLTRAAGADDAREVTEGLWRAARHLAARPVLVTFGGYFSSGKSSLLNMLIGTPLLPTGDLPETGVPCVLQSGDADQVTVRAGVGVAEIPFRTDAISKYVSLLGADGDYQESVKAVREVRITVRNPCIPGGATWVDSPGVNDKEAISELAARLAGERHPGLGHQVRADDGAGGARVPGQAPSRGWPCWRSVRAQRGARRRHRRRLGAVHRTAGAVHRQDHRQRAYRRGAGAGGLRVRAGSRRRRGWRVRRC